MYRFLSWGVTALVVLTACAGEPAEPEPPLPDELSPVAVTETLLRAVGEGDFATATALTDTRQAALLALAEGVDATEVVRALEDDGRAVAANFWSGFAQTLDAGFPPEELFIEAEETESEDGNEFVAVRVVVGPDDSRTFYLRRADGWKVDLVATFGPILAERLVTRVDMLLGSANVNAGAVLAEWSRALPSLRVAARGDISPAAHQSLIALIERLGRLQ